ncbi:MAG: hypothetical protein E7623_08015, partial [Ruminococcaceae bacterium]|nr:hypothetical protein [Oscillospiraceae bacterium]
MRKRDEFRLDVISSLDEEIVDKATKKRIALMAGMKKTAIKARLIAIIAVSVALILIASLVMIPHFLGGDPLPTDPAPTDPMQTEPVPTEPVIPIQKQIPVYEGMTVSNEAPSATLSLDIMRLGSKKVI